MPRADLRLLTSDEGVGRYTFNNHVIEHRFCRNCGSNPYAEDVASGGERSAYVNIRCLEGLDVAAIPTIEFDGRSM